MPIPLIAFYSYVDEEGVELFQVVRTPEKKFWQRRPDGKGGYINGRGKVPCLL